MLVLVPLEELAGHSEAATARSALGPATRLWQPRRALLNERHHSIRLNKPGRAAGEGKGNPSSHGTARLARRCHAGERILLTQILTLSGRERRCQL